MSKQHLIQRSTQLKKGIIEIVYTLNFLDNQNIDLTINLWICDLKSKYWMTLTAEFVMFLALLSVIWFDEFMDFPHLFLGATPAPTRVEEFIIETLSIVFVGFAVLFITYVLLRRIEKMSGFLKMCAWCHKVHVNNEWIVLEHHIYNEYAVNTSHGICPTCCKKVESVLK